MYRKTKSRIIKILKEKSSDVFRFQIYDNIKEFPNEKIDHILNIMLDDGLIKITPSNLDQLLHESFSNYIELTSKGYDYIKPWYKKLLDSITNDLLRLLTIVSVLLSIIATILSLLK